MTGADGIALTVSAVARRMGVAPATLRTWDRRYGLGPTAHTAGAHRRYTAEDLARLAVMRRLTLEGVAPAEAARLALLDPSPTEPDDIWSPAAGVAAPAAPGVEPGVEPGAEPGADSEAPVAGSDAHEPGDGPTDGQRPLQPAAQDGRPAAESPGGGRVVGLGSVLPAARGLARAAMALDGPNCIRLIVESLRTVGVIATWESLLAPVLIGIGDRYARTHDGVDAEHLLSECVMAAHRPALPLDRPVNVRPILLACAEDEQHSLVLHVLDAALRERGVQTRLLGGCVPRPALASAVRRSGPAAVFLWSSMPETGHADAVAELPGVRPRPRLVLGGPGWDRPHLPAGVDVVDSLPAAVATLVASVTV